MKDFGRLNASTESALSVCPPSLRLCPLVINALCYGLMQNSNLPSLSSAPNTPKPNTHHSKCKCNDKCLSLWLVARKIICLRLSDKNPVQHTSGFNSKGKLIFNFEFVQSRRVTCKHVHISSVIFGVQTIFVLLNCPCAL